MNLKNPETTKRVVKNLTVFAVLSLSLSAIFFSPKTSSSTLTQDCADVSGDPQAGDNCLYYSLPLCETVPGATWTIPTSSILDSGKVANHRVNCADLADLPLCTQLEDNGTTGYPLKNCVKECSDSSFDGGTGTRGSDYAVHNRDCIRFCDDPESGITADLGTNCVSRSCHQIEFTSGGTNTVPDPSSNCSILPCNLLTTDELNEAKFGDDTAKSYEYCDTDIKCYEFSESQLRYIVPTERCNMHDCRVTCVDNTSDDVQVITDKGSSYVSEYQTYINSNKQIGTTSDTLCNQTICKPIINVAYECTGDDLTTLNSSCDTSGDGAVCSNGYCYKTVDCNDSDYSDSDYCTTTSDPDVVGSTDDSSIHSWFYRPKPADIAMNGTSLRDFNYDDSFSTEGVCYSEDQLDANSPDSVWGEKAYIDTFLFGKIYMGYWHPFWLTPKSPGSCAADNIGLRGTGLGYLCGMNLNIYTIPDSSTAYYSGYAETTFTDTEGTNVVSVCLRFNAGGAIGRSCGKRECQVSCALGECNEICGSDMCVDLVVKDSDPFQCMMTSNLSNMGPGTVIDAGGTSRDCMKTIDGYIRVRAVKYGDYICSFVDGLGMTAYNSRYFTGSEKVVDNTYCASGTLSGGTCSGSKNTNDDRTLADKWRTLIQVPYVQNNQDSSDPQGYLDKTGRLFPEQECIKTGHRVTVPSLYNLANVSNSPRIFIPPLYILSASTKRDSGVIAVAPDGQTFGDTDFHYPEITVSFGSTTEKLSLDFEKTGYEEEDDQDENGVAEMTTTVDGNDGSDSFTVKVFVRKEYEDTLDRPTFCLYQKVQDENGVYLDPQRVECVYREEPEIDSSSIESISGDYRKLVVSADTSNTYDSSKIVVKYLSSSVVDDTCGSSTASCSNTVSLTNEDTAYEDCNPPVGENNTVSIEQNTICARRDVCSKLNIECIQNEIDLHNAELNNEVTDSYKLTQTYCNQVLLPSCNAKYGITTSSQATITNPNPLGTSSDSDAYGWFNEICITAGFDTKLRTVVAKKPDSSSIMGGCVIDTVNKNPAVDCNETTGKKPDCPCLEYVSGSVTLGADEYERTETPHEAGLCIDIPLPQLCSAINHTPVLNPSGSDDYYTTSSINQTSYGSTYSDITGKVHISHKYRTEGSTSPYIPVAGHADFTSNVIFGFNDVEGTCNGYWKKATNGVTEVSPTMSCLNSGGVAVWGDVTNECVRYSCDAITTSGADSNGNYQGIYTSPTDPTNRKGQSHGFATWPLTTSSDFPVSVPQSGSISCIAGYKKIGATPSYTGLNSALTTISGGPSDDELASLYNLITGYTGGTSPSRICNQLGEWQTPTNSCERITCPSINQDASGNITNVPTSSTDYERWELWSNSGGASFPSVEAAISSTLIDNTAVKIGATSTGTCNNSIGFFQIGSSAPTRVCNSLGNWESVQNPCATRCDAVTCSSYPNTCTGNQSSHGYATWEQVLDVPLNGEKDGVFGACVTGVPNPYPALKSKYGVAYATADCTRSNTSTTCSANTIPNNVNNDTVTVPNPQRVCKSVTTVGGQQNTWTDTSSSCVTGCPSYLEDSRINAGKTQHPVSSNVTGSNVSGGVITISWPSTTFGDWAYVNSNPIESQDASQYFYGRTNGYYSLARYCDPTTHKWLTPVPTCVTNNAQIKTGPTTVLDAYATYNSPTPRVTVGSATRTGTCTSGAYSDSNGSTVATAVTCSYKDANNKIDETYFDTGGVKKCNPMCKTSGGDNFSNATNPNSAGYYATGSQLQLNCKTDFGSKIVSGTSISNAFDSCGRSSYSATSDRSADGPHVNCNDNGDGTASWSSIYNDCSACRTCTRSSSVTENPSYVGPGDTDSSSWGAYYSSISSNSLNTIFYSSNTTFSCGSKTLELEIEDILQCTKNYSSSVTCGNCSNIGTVANETCIGIYGGRDWDCSGCSGTCTKHTNLNSQFNIRCIDGVWQPQQCNNGSTVYTCWQYDD